MIHRLVPSCALPCVFLLVSACGQSQSRTCVTSDDCAAGELCLATSCAARDGREVSVSLAPQDEPGAASATVLLTQSRQFSAAVAGVSEQGVTWSVEKEAGTMGRSGVFTAARTGTWHVVATSTADTSKSGSIQVLVPAIGIAVAPAAARLALDRTLQFNASVLNAVDTAVRWEVVEPGGGVISATGLYSAPTVATTPLTVHVRATSVVDGKESATAEISLHSLDISIAPQAVTLPLGGQQAFAITGQPVTWSIEEDGAGTITPDGVYTAPASWITPATIHLVATGIEDATRTAVVAVTFPTVAITASPAAAAVRFTGTLQLTATVTNAADTRVFWSVVEQGEGTISASGVYSAPGGSGRATVHALAQSFADASKTSTVELTLDLRPAIGSFTGTPDVLPSGAAATLVWSVDGAATISIDHGVGDVTGKTSVVVHPTAATTYTLTATNADGTVTATTAVQVAAGVPAISAFAASDGRLLPGQKKTLTWTVSGADTVDIEPDIGAVPASSSIEVAPASDTEYTLTASNAFGQSTARAAVRLARFRPTAPLNLARQTGWLDVGDGFVAWPSQSQNMVRLPDGTLLLVGGMFWQRDVFGGLFGPITVASAEIFDPSANAGEGGFTATVPFAGDSTDSGGFQPEQDSLAVVRLPSGDVLVAGNGLWLFDAAAKSFRSLGVNLAGADASGVLLPDGRVALLGASGPWVYDPATGAWTAYSGLGCSLANAGAPVLLPSGKIFVPGVALGCISLLWDVSNPAARPALTPSNAFISGFVAVQNDFLLAGGRALLDSFNVYDPATDTAVQNLRPLGFFTSSAPSVLLPNGMVLIVGVQDESENLATLLYDPAANGGAGAVYVGPKPLYPHSGGFAAVISDHAVLLAGGAPAAFDETSTVQTAEILEW